MLVYYKICHFPIKYELVMFCNTGLKCLFIKLFLRYLYSFKISYSKFFLTSIRVDARLYISRLKTIKNFVGMSAQVNVTAASVIK
jgi:hypothetical protein